MQKLFFIPLLAAMIYICGCASDELMGGDIVPGSDKSSIIVVDTITINAYTIKEDTVYAGNSAYLAAGYLSDPVFGISEASFAARFSNTSYGSFYQESVADSMIITLGLNKEMRRFYGDSLSSATISVYPLTASLPSGAERVYQDFNIKAIVDPKPVASISVSLPKCDSLVRIPVEKEFAELVLKNCVDSTFDQNCPGLYFKIEAANSMIRFERNSQFTEYTVYHHQKGDTASESVAFSIASNDPTVSVQAHDYSEARFSKQISAPFTPADSLLYLQALCGTKIMLDFPYIGKLKDMGSKYSIITQARLLMPLADSLCSLEDDFGPIDNIVGLGSSPEDGKDIFFNDLNTITSDGYGSITGVAMSAYTLDKKARRYSIDFTGMVKSMIADCSGGNNPGYHVCFTPSGRVMDFARSVINSPSHPSKPMKLVVECMTFEK